MKLLSFNTVLLFFYIISGISQPIVLNLIRYAGAGGSFLSRLEQTTLLPILPNYVAGLLLFLIPYKYTAEGKGLKRFIKIWAIALLDISGFGTEVFYRSRRSKLCPLIVFWLLTLDIAAYETALTVIGLCMAGASIYTIIFASTTTFTAVFSRIIIGRKLSAAQWTGVVVVTLGLVLSGLDTVEGGYPPTVVLGAVVVLIGTLLAAATNVVDELAIAHNPYPICAVRLCSYVACWGLFYGTLWLSMRDLTFFGPYHIGRSELKIPLMLVLDADWGMETVSQLFIAIFILDIIHSITFYSLLGTVGSVTTGVMKGLQVVLVFVFAGVFFCDHDSSQCFTVAKGTSLFLVVSGVMLYSFSTAKKNSRKKYITIESSVNDE